MKTILIWLLFAFLAFAIITQPERAADIVKAIWEIIAAAFSNIATFFSSLME